MVDDDDARNATGDPSAPAPQGTGSQDGDTARGAGSDDGEHPAAAPPSSAADELQEAFGHLRSAARRLVEDAAKDPALRSATAEAERVLQDLGQRAEPFARQMGEEVGRWSRRLSDLVQSAVDDLSASRSPRPSTLDEEPAAPSSDREPETTDDGSDDEP